MSDSTSEVPSAAAVSVLLPAQLPPDMAAELQRAAKSAGGLDKAMRKVFLQWLEDRADYRRAERVMKRVRSGKEKTIPAEEVYARNGLL